MAARTAVADPGLRLLGFPRRLTLASAALAEAEATELVLPEALVPFAGAGTVTLPVRRRQAGAGEVRLRLDRTTPPGSYPGELRIAGKGRPVSIEVAPAPRLRLFPPSVELAAEAKGTAEAALTVTNEGNVAIDIPERTAVGLFDDEGIETAFADTYRQEADDPLKLVGHWLGKLRDAHGGLLNLQVAAGAGPLEPGAAREVTLRAAFRESLRAGHSYHGMWALGPVNQPVLVTVRKGGEADGHSRVR